MNFQAKEGRDLFLFLLGYFQAITNLFLGECLWQMRDIVILNLSSHIESLAYLGFN